MNNPKDYCTFGVYSLDFDFFKGMSGDKIINFLQYLGWDKGYLLFPHPDEKTFRHKLREFFHDDLSKIVYTQTLLDNVIADKDIGKKCLIKAFHDNRIKAEPHKYFPNIQIHEMKWEDLLQMLTPWFLEGYFLTFVDPYFNPGKDEEHPNSDPRRWFEPLNKIMNLAEGRKYFTSPNKSNYKLHIEYYCVLPGKAPNAGTNNVNTNNNEDYYQKDDLEKKLKGIFEGCRNIIVPENCDFKISIWRKWGSRHDRYIMSEVGGTSRQQKEILISFSRGLDEAQTRSCLASIAFHHLKDNNKIRELYSKEDDKIAEITKSSPSDWAFTTTDFLKQRMVDISAIVGSSPSE